MSWLTVSHEATQFLVPTVKSAGISTFTGPGPMRSNTRAESFAISGS